MKSVLAAEDRAMNEGGRERMVVDALSILY